MGDSCQAAVETEQYEKTNPDIHRQCKNQNLYIQERRNFN